MRHSVMQRAKRLTAHQSRMRSFEESMYQILRKYQDGDFAATAGTALEQLTIPLTSIFDEIRSAANVTFGRRKA